MGSTGGGRCLPDTNFECFFGGSVSNDTILVLNESTKTTNSVSNYRTTLAKEDTIMSVEAEVFIAADVLAWNNEGMTRQEWIDLLMEMGTQPREAIIEKLKGDIR